jgi:hypothetical protein
MIDLSEFFLGLGAVQVPGRDEHLLLPGGVRLQADAQGWTAIFESAGSDEEALTALFEVARQFSGLVPLSTRSGGPALRWAAHPALPDTLEGLASLRQAMRFMVDR